MVELDKSMEGELTFIHKHIDFVLEEFFTVFLHLLRHGCAEHHDLFLVGGFDENFLHIGPHAGAAEDLVTLINDEVFALSKGGRTLSKRMSLCFASSLSRPGVAMMI